MGAVDELNATIGVALQYIEDEKIKTCLFQIQNDLFDMGADICIPDDDSEMARIKLKIGSDQVISLETWIDEYNMHLPPLNSFILPGGSKISAFLHLARTVCRRAEREFIRLTQKEKNLNTQIQIYLNRLSDFLFVLCRYVNADDKKDVLWKPNQKLAG